MLKHFLLAVGVSTIVLSLLVSEFPLDPHLEPSVKTGYDLTLVKAPVLRGTAQYLFSWVLHLPFIGRILSIFIINDNKISAVR
jgi:hypothetical protein